MLESSEKDLCVIIPCAGLGTRLGLHFPKELFPLEAGVVLIDHCFSLLKPVKHRVRIVIVIQRSKLEIIQYLEKYSLDFEIVFIYQSPKNQEMIGAILSAQNLFLQNNLVMFPDTLIKPKGQAIDLITETCNLLKSENGCVFWVKYETNVNTLLREGTLNIKNHNGQLRVLDYIDKPKKIEPFFNGYWGAFAFHTKKANEVLNIMQKIIQQDSSCDFKKTFLRGSPAIEIKESIDLGVWEAIKSYMGGIT
ncbi:2-C-methyl-D-erythritol 4-phosphate cytidylyltransferase [Bacillus hominis]|uniref:NTP transferase domain-containing protein n=1 Tax=Bacillus hominis TaxID=2817478 RepID=UPI0025A0E67F|nr:NTP transferase domain-containing protein [Bacillus hominis]MDM5436502.1 2-C-methyl-D-erythritol 4-phosphate cytidylyltransferase [Bacillus hominis]